MSNIASYWDMLPKDLKGIIYGISLQCCRCGKFAITDSKRENWNFKYLQTPTGLLFCSVTCLKKVIDIFSESENYFEILDTISAGSILILWG